MIHKKKPFKVFKHPASGYQAVKVGFSWPGLFFSGIWLLLKRLWGHALIFLSITLVFSYIETGFEKEENVFGMVLILWLEIGLYIIVGVKGNEWYAESLQKREFELIGIVEAETPGAAIEKYIKA